VLLCGAKRRRLLTTPVLKSFATSNVTSLDLSDCALTLSNLEYIAKTCAHLQTLSLSGSTALNDHALGLIAKRCKALRSLNICSCRHVTQRGIEQLAMHAKKLECINVEGVSEALDLACVRAALPLCGINRGMPLMWSKISDSNGGTPGVFLESTVERGLLLEFRPGERFAWRAHRITASTGFDKQRSVLLLSRAADGRRFYNVLRPTQGEYAGHCEEGEPEPSLHACHRPWRDGSAGRWTSWKHAMFVQQLGFCLDWPRKVRQPAGHCAHDCAA